MKNTVRARLDGATKPVSAQIKTSCRKLARKPARSTRNCLGKEFRMPKDALHHACIAIVDRAAQELVCKVPLSETEFLNFWDFSNSKRTPGDEIIADAIRQHLATPDLAVELNELEAASNQSEALNQMLYNCLDGAEGGSFSESIKCGMIELMAASSNRLEKSLATLRALIFPNVAATAQTKSVGVFGRMTVEQNRA